MFHLSLTSRRLTDSSRQGGGGQSLVLMVGLQRKQTSTGDVRQREQGKGSMLGGKVMVQVRQGEKGHRAAFIAQRVAAGSRGVAAG